MKKLLCMFLYSVFMMSLLCSCSEDVPAPEVNISYDAVSRFTPDIVIGESAEEDVSQADGTSQSSEPTVGDFVVKMKKYDYNNKYEVGNWKGGTDFRDVSIAIVDITNETNKNYSVTIKGKYLNEDGKVIRTETQTWDQFESGLQKYFLFRPEMKFDKFEYTITTEEFTGECWKNFLKVDFVTLEKSTHCALPETISTPDGPKFVDGLYAIFHVEEHSTRDYAIGYTYYVLFDENGDVICTGHQGRCDYCYACDIDDDTRFIAYTCRENNGKLTEWPEEFRGKVTGLYFAPEITEDVIRWWETVSITINE